jgi:hypothetical protein
MEKTEKNILGKQHNKLVKSCHNRADVSVTFPPTIELPAVGGAVGKAQFDV